MGLRDLYIALIYAAFFVIGPTTPFVFTLGYLWVDTFYPQYVSRWSPDTDLAHHGDRGDRQLCSCSTGGRRRASLFIPPWC